MCGIIGIVSRRNESVLLELLGGMKILEHRGYDSAGVAISVKGLLHVQKREGEVDNLIKAMDPSLAGRIGIGHTRWATHGEPTDRNAHPHLSADSSIAVVHNGIIENYRALRAMLKQEGVVFLSDTDSEVLPHLIERTLRSDQKKSLTRAVMEILPLIQGEYAFVVLSKRHPDTIVAATCERPLIVGRGSVSLSIASIEDALVGLAGEVAEVKDGDVVSIEPTGILTHHRKDGMLITGPMQFSPISLHTEQITKGQYSTFTEKEIHEQPSAIRQAMLGRIIGNTVDLPNLTPEANRLLKEAPYLVTAACGTSYHALLAGRLLFEKIAGVPFMVEHASEFQDRLQKIKAKLVIGVSQSGETADTVAALNDAKRRGAQTIAITNKRGSQLARAADMNINIQAGPERAVASTKAYTAQVVVLMLLAIHTGTLRGTLSPERRAELIAALRALPAQIDEVLNLAKEVEAIAQTYKHSQRILIIGKGFAVPVALEAALKIQELPYVDAAGFPSGELKHGPLALVTHGVPVIVIALNGAGSSRAVSNAEEVLSRGGDIIAIVTQGSPEEDHLRDIAKHMISLPKAPEEMTPILGVIPLQLFALYLAMARGTNVDKPRNLAKAVTTS